MDELHWGKGNDQVLIVAANATIGSMLECRKYICQNRRGFQPSGWIAPYVQGRIEYVFPIDGEPEDDVILSERPDLAPCVASGEHPNPESDARRVIHLDAPQPVGPIVNDKLDRRGRNLAFTPGSARYTTIDRIRSASRTSEL